ncbi:MAG TPA: hypothetical protein VGF38_18410 [Ktedonobacterales bacterium]
MVGDEEKYRRWFVEKMIVQIEADGDRTRLLRLEGSILTLLEAVNSWRHSASPSISSGRSFPMACLR